MILSSQICLDYKGQEEGKEAEKGIQYTFLFLFPMHPQMQKSQIGLPEILNVNPCKAVSLELVCLLQHFDLDALDLKQSIEHGAAQL